MDNKTEGAWIIHHAQKLQTVTSQDFDQLAFAGKCGLVLSSIAATDQSTIKLTKVEAFAKANGISPKAELPSVLSELRKQKLIEVSSGQIEVLGLSSYSILDHTAQIFMDGEPSPEERAVILIADNVSELPATEKMIAEEYSDTHKIKSSDMLDLLLKSESIGFFDVEPSDINDRIIFNGNLFRSDDIRKISYVLGSLNDEDRRKVEELNEMLHQYGCITYGQAVRVVNEDVFYKLQSIGVYDVNTIGNEYGSHRFVTRPAAFSKFSSSIADDAFDLAKAFVSSLTYGMTTSPNSRGHIKMISLLMRKLIDGDWVGPATAIGKDYQVLELKGVVEVVPSSGSMFKMRLLKKDVGKLALSVILEGEATNEVLCHLPSANVTSYTGPETNRAVVRKNITEPLKKNIGNLLTEIRTGGLRG